MMISKKKLYDLQFENDFDTRVDHFLDWLNEIGYELPEKSPIEMVQEFHRAFWVETNVDPTQNASIAAKLIRLRLVREEAQEFMVEIDRPTQDFDKYNFLKEAADLLYVLLGTLDTFGLADRFEDVFTEVHRSNMSKLDDNGKPIYNDAGKVMKGPNYSPADIEGIFEGNDPNKM